MMEYEQLTAPLLARTPLGRFALAEEIAPAVLFLACPQARYITGQTLAVDGGFSVAG
jgi:NAD(P)-dependent dehydrogenase (short-subunit alcohol dehydrogenase family)